MASYTKPSDYPVQTPLLTKAVVEVLMAKVQAEGMRPKAFDTLFRYSDAGRCGRAMGLDALGVERSDPADGASEWRMALGTMVHDEVQKALMLKVVNGGIEVASRLEDASGHADAIVELFDGRTAAYELKTQGSFAFDKSTGINRRRRVMEHPEGPATSAKIQGALNAVAHDADVLIIGCISMEAVSLQLAADLGIGMLDRVMAEWMYEKAEFVPWAERELERMASMADALRRGVLPARHAIGDEMEVVKLDPEASKPSWLCTYCAHRTTCTMLGADPVEVERVKAH